MRGLIVKELIELLKKEYPEKQVMLQCSHDTEFDYMTAYSVRVTKLTVLAEFSKNEIGAYDSLPVEKYGDIEKEFVVIDFQ
ncbi:MAG: hypothetical protein ACYC97_05600 [Metallibacterium sp.]